MKSYQITIEPRAGDPLEIHDTGPIEASALPAALHRFGWKLSRRMGRRTAVTMRVGQSLTLTVTRTT